MKESGPSRGRVAFDFIVVALIWGSTWLVIKDQISEVPPGWTVTWRFALASIGMFALALFRRESLRLDRQAMVLVMLIGLFQFCANVQFVYRAEAYLTSGLVAVIYALLMVPNALLSRLFLKTPLGGRFLAGSAVTMVGIALLLINEARAAPAGTAVTLGIALALAGLLSASATNVMQAGSTARRLPTVPLIAWAMLWGTLFDAVFSWVISGPPQFDSRGAYWGGVAYLAMLGSVVTFPLYYNLIRTMGAGRAAYTGVLVPVVAMALSTLFEGYRWTGLATAGSVLAIAGLLIALSGKKAA